MELNKYDLVEWVADIINKGRVRCANCIFEYKCNDYFVCTNKELLIKELLKNIIYKRRYYYEFCKEIQ